MYSVPRRVPLTSRPYSASSTDVKTRSWRQEALKRELEGASQVMKDYQDKKEVKHGAIASIQLHMYLHLRTLADEVVVVSPCSLLMDCGEFELTSLFERKSSKDDLLGRCTNSRAHVIHYRICINRGDRLPKSNSSRGPFSAQYRYLKIGSFL